MSDAENTGGREDPLEGLEERLKSHNQAFESLLALTPAREYYGSHFVDGRDPSEQWNRKKQTKEEKRAAKRAKLDPANQKSALDVMREREAEAKAKRKRADADDADQDDVKEDAEPTGKRQKVVLDEHALEAKRREKVLKRKEKRDRKKEKLDQKKEKAEAKRARKEQQTQTGANDAVDGAVEGEPMNEDVHEAPRDEPEEEFDSIDVSGLADAELDTNDNNDADDVSMHSSAPTTPVINSPAFDLATNHSTASSSSSIESDGAPIPSHRKSDASVQKLTVDTNSIPPSSAPTKTKDAPSGTSSPKIQLPHINDEELQARLRARIEALRAARKADGPDGKPAKSRQELLDQRRKKEEQRKANKKAQRQKAKEDEQRKREEQLRGSGSPLGRTGDIFSPQPRSSNTNNNNFSFSRLAFQDGSAATADLSELHEPKKKKGPQDARTALQAAQNRDARVAGFDADKQAGIAEKDMWFNARKRAGGERVRDDTSLLKKALKRKEKQKSKSEKEWKDREQAVVKGKEIRQKKREANLQKRRDEKGSKGRKKKAGAGKKKGGNGGGRRPGFEGRFKA